MRFFSESTMAPSLGNHSMSAHNMYVLKRDGRKERVMFDKITSRVQHLCYDLNMEFVDPSFITMKVISGIYAGVTTVELDNLAAETAATMAVQHPDYAVLAARIAVSNLHKVDFRILKRSWLKAGIHCSVNVRQQKNEKARMFQENTRVCNYNASKCFLSKVLKLVNGNFHRPFLNT